MKKLLSTITVIALIVAVVSCSDSTKNNSSNTQTVIAENISTFDADNYKLDNSVSFFNITTKKDDVFNIKFVVGNFKVKDNKVISGKVFLDLKSVDAEAKPINKTFLSENFMNAKYFPQAVLEIIRLNEFTDRKPLFGFKPTHTATALLMFKNVNKEISIPVKINISDGVLTMESATIDFNGSDWNIGSEKHLMLQEAEMEFKITAEINKK